MKRLKGPKWRHFFTKTILNRFKILMLFFVVVSICIYILMFPESSANGVRVGLLYSSEILIPSLFPFMFISSFIVRSSLSSKLSRFLNVVTTKLFKLPGCTGSTILFGMIGGYPTGAKGISALFERNEITNDEAELMSYFVVGAGPAFVMSVVGNGLFKNNILGIVLLLSQLAASLLTGIIASRVIFWNDRLTPQKKIKKDSFVIDLSSALVNSCTDATISIINMCSLVTIFSVVRSILTDCGIIDLFSQFLINCSVSENISRALVPMFLEVTSGCFACVDFKSPIELIAFGLGFAGLCVHFQVMSSIKKIKFSKTKFFIFRIIHGILASVITHFMVMIFPQAKTVMTIFNEKVTIGFSSHTQGSVALILLCVCFVLSLETERQC